MIPLRFLALGIVLTLPALAGCLAGKAEGLLPALDPQNLVAPGAQVDLLDGGRVAQIVWKGPAESKGGFVFTIPPGATRVDGLFVRNPEVSRLPSHPGYYGLYNAATHRPRCQVDLTQAWFTPFKTEFRCSGLTQVDPLDGAFLAQWRTHQSFNYQGLTGEKVGTAYLHANERLEITITSEPLDGQAALIHLDQLSMPTFEALPTEVLAVTASDGVRLYAELTRPNTDLRVPTIIVSNPYNQATRAAKLRPENGTINDWVPRGYALLSADVRGYAKSEGCVEVWGPREQRDQAELVEWAARQPWSNGKVGFYGQSYVGTTPVEAASLSAPHLTTIITVAPVINAYEDWHFGGVPNGENLGSPVGYQEQDALYWTPANELLALNPAAAVGKVGAQNLFNAVGQADNSFCDPTLALRANDPRAVYDDFYRERDFKAKVGNVGASVFYTQGFYDTNVKSQMIPGWFDRLQVPKKGLFGDWIHQHPPRADQELLFHAWFDQWLMGRDTGILETPVVEVRTNVDTVRTASDWPPKDAAEARYGLDLAGKKLLDRPSGSGTAELLFHPAANLDAWGVGDNPPEMPSLVLAGEALRERLYVAGQLQVALRATLQAAGNVHFYAELRDVAPTGDSKIVTFGMLNAALRNGYDRYEPVEPGSTIDVSVPLLVTEYVVPAGHRLQLELRAADVQDWAGSTWGAPQVLNGAGGRVTLDGAGSALRLSVLTAPGDLPAPGSAGPNPLAGPQGP